MMSTPNSLNELKQLATNINQKEKLLANKLKKLPKSPQQGDIFLFAQGDTIGLEWVVLFPHHKNEELLLTVPADTNPMAGSTDITISEEALCGPLTIRCSQGMWIHKTDFNIESRVGILENWHWQRALNKTEQIFEGKLQSTAWQKEKDADPEYKDWMNQVSQDSETLRQALYQVPNECEDSANYIENVVNLVVPKIKRIETGVVKLSKSLQDRLEAMCRSPVPVRARSSISKSPEDNAVKGKEEFIIELEGTTIRLLVEIEPQKTENTFEVFLKVEPSQEATQHLPDGLELIVLDETEEIIVELRKNATDNHIQRYLGAKLGEQFSVKIRLGSVSVIRKFEI